MRFALAPLAALALFAASPVAHAQQPPRPPAPAPAPQAINAQVMIIHATNKGTGISPKLGDLAQLKSPPFSTSFNSFDLLSDTKLALKVGTPSTTAMPTRGENLVVTFTGMAPPSPRDPTPKYVISTSVQQAGGKDPLPLLTVNAQSGKWFFITGQSYNAGTLIIAIKVL